MNKVIFTAPVVAVFLLGGCVTVPAPLEGEYPDFQADQVTDQTVGAQVRWGGDIISSQPEANRTCFEILARDLDRSYRPVRGDRTYGRFLACKDGFEDPAVFEQGREVTVIGRVDGMTSGEVGEYNYQYPLLLADTLYLWPERPDVVVADYGYWGPYWGPYGWYGPYGFGYHRYPYRSRIHFHGSVHLRN